MSKQDAPQFESGTRLAHYSVEHVLGVGAMGTVYRAHDTSLDRPVAVKVLKPRIADEPGILARFVREARAAARVNHHNLTHIYFVGRDQSVHFFAMEYVPGETLEELIARTGPLDLAEGIELLMDAARGLSAAHRGGVIHRDVKPSNLIRREDGTLKVTDFGLALSLNADVRLTGGGTIMGTPTYMSPEQCRGTDTDERSDVYALGLCAWFLFGGHPPFDAQQLGRVIEDQLTRDLPSLHELRPELPPALDDVLARLCAKDPAERPADMDEVLELLRELKPKPMRLAPFLARTFSAGFDLAVLAVVAGALQALVLFGHTQVFDRAPGIAEYFLGDLPMFAAAVFTLMGLEWRIGCSVGKYLFNLRVVRADGSALTMRDAVLRTALRFPALLVFLLPSALFTANSLVGNVLEWTASICGGLQLLSVVVAFPWMLFNDGVSLVDRIAGTRVVYRFDDEAEGHEHGRKLRETRQPLPARHT